MSESDPTKKHVSPLKKHDHLTIPLPTAQCVSKLNMLPVHFIAEDKRDNHMMGNMLLIKREGNRNIKPSSVGEIFMT